MNRIEFLKKTAADYLANELNVIAVDNQKKALYAWNDYKEDKISAEAIGRQLDNPKADGLAIICGQISNNLEVIDFDLKHDISGDLWNRYLSLIPADLVSKLYIVTTKSKGYHIYYRCEVIEGNKKLASRPATPEELKDTPHLKQVTLIETRGEGGYVVAPPSTGYHIFQENEVPVLTIDERDLLLDAARSFQEIRTEERARFTPTGTPFVISPFDDYNEKSDSVALLMRHGWTIEQETNDRVYLKRPGTTTAKNSGNYMKSNKLFYVWTTSSQFIPEKAYSPSAVYAILEHNNDFSSASKELIRLGYGTKKTIESLGNVLKKPFETDYKFWEVIPAKKDTVKIEVSLTKLVTFIHEKGGFTGYKYSKDSENIIVQVKDGFVREVELYDIKQFIKNEVLSLPDTFDGITPDELLEVVYRDYLRYLSTNFMDFLNVTPLEFLKDTKESAYFPFRNGIVEVYSKLQNGERTSGATFHKYGEFKKVIWVQQMIDADITLFDNLADTLDFTRIDFCKFIRMASGNDDDKFEYFISILGYLLHKYKDPKSAFAVILAEETENEAEGGGTGKGLFVKGIQKLIPTELFDGKQWKPGKSFAFQRIDLDTKLIAIEDARKSFSFESMYSFITEGLPVEKKNLKEFYIPFADAPKITISTNYAIPDEGNHAKRRQKVLEFSNFFSPANTPFDYLKRMMFEDWDADEWNRFYNFMFFSVMVYLEQGILQVDQSSTNKIKNIKVKYTEDLLLYFYSVIEEPFQDFKTNKELYNEFLIAYDLKSQDYDKVRFGKGMRYIAETLGYVFEEKNMKVQGKTFRGMKITEAPVKKVQS